MTTEAFVDSTLQASVVVCSHNPKPAYISRALGGLRAQTLPFDEWELLLIDNASDHPLSATYDLSWHPRSKHVREERLGAAHARYRALNESSSNLIVFVDDDNVLDSDYLRLGIGIARSWPILGTWGGQNIGEFEVQPAAYLGPYIQGLAVRPCKRDSWSNIPTWSEAFPFGAGMFIRRQVMIEYHKAVAACPFRLSIGPKGRELLRGEDFDMNLTACDMGLGCGVFQALKLIHIMPAQRVTDEYLLRLEYGHKYSNALLACIRGNHPPDPLSTWRARIKLKLWARRSATHTDRFRAAAMKGVHDALRTWQEHSAQTS